MGLTVITHTRNHNDLWLERCKVSVAAALRPGMVHKIIPGFENWSINRYKDTQCDEFIAFVDDDDTIDSNALSLCLNAIKKSGAGIAFTNEVTVDKNQKIIKVHNDPKNYEAVRRLPRAIHHLAVIRSNAIDPAVLDLQNEIGFGIDWFIKASAALVHGAIHVPMSGYYWTIHDNSLSKQDSKKYASSLNILSSKIESLWGKRSGSIPVYDI